MAKMLEFWISGSYKTAQRDTIDFENVQGIVPFQDEDVATMHVRSRYAPRWIREAKGKDGKPLYPERVQRVREVHIDNVQETEGEPSFVGKDIKLMSFEELQDLALAKDLRRVPLYKVTDLRQTRVVAYDEYVQKVQKGDPIKYNEDGFNFAKLPSLIVDGAVRRDTEGKISNDDIIEAEMQSPASPRDRLTLADLKGIAKTRNISFHSNIGYEALYAKLYGG